MDLGFALSDDDTDGAKTSVANVLANAMVRNESR
jgi:hypothetical protein